MHTDSFCWIGHSHISNQDYTNIGPKHIIVSDGCSGSPNTDWGSRFISKAAEKSLGYFPGEAFALATINEATKMRMAADLSPMCLDATLLVATQVDNKIIAKMYGDGVIIFITPRGMEVHSLEYIKEAPFYINYLNDKSRLDGFTNHFGFEQCLTKFTLNNGVIIDDSIDEYSSKEYYSVVAPLDTKAVILMSDGVRSFMKRVITESSASQEHVELHIVLEKMLDFKNYFGAFVERRMKKFVKIQMPELGWQNMDDVSVAGMIL